MTSLQKKLMSGLVPIVAFFVLLAVAVWHFGGQTTDSVSNTVKRNTVASSKLSELAVMAQQIRRYEKEYFVYVGNVERRENYIKEWSGVADKIDTSLAAISNNKEAAFTTDDLREARKWKEAADFYFSEMKRIFQAVNQRSTQMASEASANASASASESKKGGTPEPARTPTVMFTPAEVNTMIGPGKDRLSAELIAGVSKMSKAKSEQTLALPQIAKDGFNQLLLGAAALALLGALVALFVLITLPTAIKTPIAALTTSVEALSKGDVAKPQASTRVAEFESLERSIERLRQSQKILLERMGRKFD